jgi:hypothetical protein
MKRRKAQYNHAEGHAVAVRGGTRAPLLESTSAAVWHGLSLAIPSGEDIGPYTRAEAQVTESSADAGYGVVDGDRILESCL